MVKLEQLQAECAPRIREYMTHSPVTVSCDERLIVAHRVMRERRIRHLPVLRQGVLVGIVSLGDLELMQTFESFRFMSVLEAMTPDPYAVKANMLLAGVVEHMAAHRLGSVVVLDDDERVVGIFTAVDGLRLLGAVLRKTPAFT